MAINQSVTLEVPPHNGSKEQTVTYSEADDINRKSAIAIQPGAMTQGVLICAFRTDRDNIVDASFEVSFLDVLKKSIKSKSILKIVAVPSKHTRS